MVRTILAGLILAILALAFGLPLLLIAWISGTVGPLYSAAAFAFRVTFAVAGVRVCSIGEENIPAGACLFMANHTSALDPLAVFISIPRRISFLAKEELFRIPLLGLAMRRARFISVDRSARESAASSASRAIRQLREGGSVVIYPEGTRSFDGRLLPFRRGAFSIAIRGARPVVPVTVIGAERILARGKRWIRPGQIVVRFHPAIDVSGYAEADRAQLMRRVRAAIAAALPLEPH
jgi:1-acyl-sn-glycerol-3-phosphate acyltransferase